MAASYTTPEFNRSRARVAGLISQGRAPDDPELIAAKRECRELSLIERIDRALSEFAPLTDRQVARVAALLNASKGAVHVTG